MSNREILRTDTVSVRIMELERGTATEWHYHTEVNDFFVCLEGVVLIETREPERSVALFPGQQAEVSPLAVHRVLNNPVVNSRYLLIQGVGRYDFITV